MPKTLKDFQDDQVRTLQHFLNPALYQFLEEHQDEPVEEVVKRFSFGNRKDEVPKPQAP